MKARRVKRDEAGFTMIEILTTILIIGVLAAIAVPVYLQFQKSGEEKEVKSNLLQAAILIDQEKIDNNGLYPKYLPNEILENPKWKDFSYTYSDNRLAYCLQSTPEDNRWFVSWKDKTPSKTVCTQPNIGEGSTSPWGNVTVGTANVATASNTWAQGKANATANVTWGEATCSLGNVSYQLRTTNNATGDIITSNWMNTLTTSFPLTNFLPEDSIKHEVRARCTMVDGSNYSFVGTWGGAKTDTVAKLNVANPTLSAVPVTYTWGNAATAPSYSSSWGSQPYCPPIADLKYNLSASQTGATTWNSGDKDWTTSSSGALNSTFKGDVKVDMKLTASCYVDATREYDSAGVNYSSFMVIQTPAKPTFGTTTLPTTGTSATVRWSAVTCAAGTPLYSLDQVVPTAREIANTENLGITMTTTKTTDYTVSLNLTCNGTNISSEPSATSTLSFKTATPAPVFAAPTIGYSGSGAATLRWTEPQNYSTTATRYTVALTGGHTVTYNNVTALSQALGNRSSISGQDTTVTITAYNSSGGVIARTSAVFQIGFSAAKTTATGS
jgi:prepilin-type N-terminal cleavage/methylation domain-containing protein